MPSDPTVGIVIVNYNGGQLLIDCLSALFNGTRTDVGVAIVDNASSDGSLDEVARRFPGVTLLPQGANLGVAAGNNLGIEHWRRRGCPYVLLLNYDTLPAPNLVDALLAVAAPDLLVSGHTVFWDDSTRSNCHAGDFNWTLGRLREWFFGRPVAEIRGLQTVEIADTCCLLVPTTAFDRVGTMDPNYFLYYDDTDFVVRARRAGFKCVVNPEALLRHYERAASGTGNISPVSVYYSSRNRPYFMGKHAPTQFDFVCFLMYFSLTRTATLVRWVVSGRPHMAGWMLRGVADYARGRMGSGHLRERKARGST